MSKLLKVLVTASLYLLLANVSAAQKEPPKIGYPMLPNSNICHFELPSDLIWSDQEKWAWQEKICLGKIANMSEFGKAGVVCDPKNSDNWPISQTLSSNFIKTILFYEPFKSALSSSGVRIQCAKFIQPIDLADINLSRPVWIDNSRIEGSVDFSDLKSKSVISLDGSIVDGLINANRMEISGNLILENSEFLSGINIVGARIGGNLELDDAEIDEGLNATGIRVGGSLLLRRTIHSNDLILIGASISGNLEASSSVFPELFQADQLKLEGSLLMGGKGQFKTVRLVGANINGRLDTSSSTFSGQFNATNLDLGGDIFMRNKASFNEVVLYGANVSGSVFIVNSSVTTVFNAGRLVVLEDLILGGGSSYKFINLRGAKVIGNLVLSGSIVSELLNATTIEVGNSLWMRDGGSYNGVDLNGAKIGSQLQLRDSDFKGHVDLTSIFVAEELQLTSPRSMERQKSGNKGYPPPRWTPEARLTLRNAKVGALNDLENAWNIQPGNLDLIGFVYGRLGGLRATRDSAMASRSHEWLLNWIEKQSGYDIHYNPQPFEQLANVLRNSGYPNKADRILFEARNHQRDTKETPFLSKIKLWIQWALIGYGYYNWVAGFWFVLLILIGTCVFQLSSVNKYKRVSDCFWYSFDMALPIIKLNENHKDIKSTESHFIYLYVHKIAGFILISFVIAGLSGLTK